MEKIINIDEINRAAMEGREDVLIDLCRVFDHESYSGAFSVEHHGRTNGS